MYKNKKISVYLPCRNEAGHLNEVIKSIPTFVDEILIISNKSTDDTLKEAKLLGLTAYEDNRVVDGGIGYGFAHMTGIKKATGDIIVTADCDGTYPIHVLDKILNYFLEQKVDFLSCNRYPLTDSTKIPFILKLGVNILNLETRILYGIKIDDVLSGMWILNKKAKSKLKLSSGGWNLSPEIKIQAATNPAIKFAEFHINQSIRYGQSKQRYWKTGFEHLFWIFKNKFKKKTMCIQQAQVETQNVFVA